ncbi:MAG: hypothetical protein M1840_001287 [Geoglossum simile]|nr:MAG: hypothetical protein M1840_001287 [Geoglossum simile]
MMPKKIAVIGLGKRSLKHAIASISKSLVFELVAVCDPNEAVLQEFGNLHPEISCFTSVEKLIHWQDGVDIAHVDCAYVAVPHCQYGAALPPLFLAGIHVLKEKPAAINATELREFQSLANLHKVRLVTAAQDRYSSRSSRLSEWLPLIGELHFVEGSRKIMVSDLGNGWRASKELAGGGALIDIGWHLVDAVLGLVGKGFSPTVANATLFMTRPFQSYDCEDSAHLTLSLLPGDNVGGARPISCNLRVSRIGHEEIDELIFTGRDGLLISRGGEIKLHLQLASGEKIFDLAQAHEKEFDQVLLGFYQEVCCVTPSESYQDFGLQDILVNQTIDTVYGRHRVPAIHAPNTHYYLSGAVCNENRELGKQMQWPVISRDVEDAVQSQLHESISIYDNGGIFHTFETEFKEALNRPKWHALLHNSGTNALHALFHAAQFQPGDEVIFPVYTFHATCSPMMHFGVHPIFCDVLPNGNICPNAIERALTPRTKAVVVTHMWGFPCDMGRILQMLADRPEVLLLEDCSHAHGATIDGQYVGTFGDGAAWSLQGQKIVSGGEGGIVLTRHADFHYRQLIWGHYNKRCKIEIPPDHFLRPYSLTGAGLKNRAHPLAVAIALNQLRKLKSFHMVKQKFATRLASELSNIPFLEIPEPCLSGNSRSEPGWYVFILRFKAHRAPRNLTRETFVRELSNEGLHDVDIPKSTGLLHREPLFTNPAVVLPHIYSEDRNVVPISKRSFDDAQAFYDEAIKLPVCAVEKDYVVMEHYIKTFKIVAERWIDLDRASCSGEGALEDVAS